MYRDVTERTRTEMQLKVARQQLEAALAKERELSRLDALTGVGNRRAFYEVLEAERSRAVRYSRPLTVAYLDLDNFKKVNDSKGHGAGDLLLTKVANKLRTSLRITDFVSRLGGDEFAVVLPETNVHAAEKVLEKLRVTLLEETSAHYCEVTFSIGAVTFLNPKDSLEVMVRIADETMYTAKTNGKNRTCLALVG
jgi:diguanylate cyclase (GGDEF)-like protein